MVENLKKEIQKIIKHRPKNCHKIVPKIGGKTCQKDYFLQETGYFVGSFTN